MGQIIWENDAKKLLGKDKKHITASEV